MALRSIVRQEHNHAPRIAQALLLTLGMEVIYMFLGPVGESVFPAGLYRPLGGLLTGIFGTLAALNLSQRACRHKRWCFVTGAVAVGGFFAMATLCDPFHGANRTKWELTTDAFLCLLGFGSVGGFINVVLAMLKSLIFGPPLVQDGTLCPTCAYPVVYLPMPRCPECGTRFTPADLSPGPPSPRREWRRLAMLALIAAAIGGAIYLIYPYPLAYALVPRRTLAEWPIDYLRLRPKLAAEIFADYIERGDDQERALAAYYMWRLLEVPEPAFEVLERTALRDPVPRVRFFAVQSLLFLDPERLEDLVPQLLADADPQVRRCALSAGDEKVQPKTVPFLIRALDDSDAMVRNMAFQRLKASADEHPPYDPSASKDQRLLDQKVWQQWWDRRRSSSPVGQAGPG